MSNATKADATARKSISDCTKFGKLCMPVGAATDVPARCAYKQSPVGTPTGATNSRAAQTRTGNLRIMSHGADAKKAEKKAVSETGVAPGVAPEISALVSGWATLPPVMQQAILAMVAASNSKEAR